MRLDTARRHFASPALCLALSAALIGNPIATQAQAPRCSRIGTRSRSIVVNVSPVRAREESKDLLFASAWESRSSPAAG